MDKMTQKIKDAMIKTLKGTEAFWSVELFIEYQEYSNTEERWMKQW